MCLTLQFNPELKKEDMKDITVNNVVSKHWDCGWTFFLPSVLVHFVFQMPCVCTVSPLARLCERIKVCWEAWLGPPLFEEPAAPVPLPQYSGMSPLRLGLWVQTGSSCNISENEGGELCYRKSSTTSTRQSITSYFRIVQGWWRDGSYSTTRFVCMGGKQFNSCNFFSTTGILSNPCLSC